VGREGTVKRLSRDGHALMEGDQFTPVGAEASVVE
jgi:hypothetical protein